MLKKIHNKVGQSQLLCSLDKSAFVSGVNKKVKTQ